MWNHFRDNAHNLFFYTSDHSESLIARKHETSDNVIPSSNSTVAHVLMKIGSLTDNQQYSQMAFQMCQNFRNEIIQHGPYYANWGMLLGKLTYPDFEIAALGENALEMTLEMQKYYLPTCTFAGGISGDLPLLANRLIENQSVIYVCQDKVCNLPVFSTDEALRLILNDPR